MKAIFNFTLFVTFENELKEFVAFEAKASGKTPVFGMLKRMKSLYAGCKKLQCNYCQF